MYKAITNNKENDVGDITAFVRTDLILYSIIINIVLLIYTKNHSLKENYSSKLFRRILIAITVVAVMDATAWFALDFGNKALIPLNYWSNAIFLTLTALPAAFGLSYLDYKIFGNEEKSRKRLKIYLIPTYINIVFLIYNFFDEGFFFYINDMNQYFRGIGVPLSIGAIYVFFIATVVYFYRYKYLITGRLVQGIIIFFFTPIVGSLLQQLAYGITFGTPSYTLAVFITFLILEKDKMAKDVLTNLYTRSNLEARLRFKLKAGHAFTVIMADLNGFKEINDTFGHLEGDKVLQKVAEILRLNTNIEDMVCRYGGDEFLILIEYGQDIGLDIIKRIDKALAKYNQDNRDYKVHLSYGHVFVADPTGIVMEELLHSVDKKMYEDKALRKEA